MRRTLSFAALICLVAGPASASNGTLCGGRVELLSISPQWTEQAPGRNAIGLRVAVANRSGEAILLQPLLMANGRPQQGHPMMLVRNGETSFALRLPADQHVGMPPEALIRSLGASCRLG